MDQTRFAYDADIVILQVLVPTRGNGFLNPLLPPAYHQK